MCFTKVKDATKNASSKWRLAMSASAKTCRATVAHLKVKKFIVAVDTIVQSIGEAPRCISDYAAKAQQSIGLVGFC